MILGDINRIQYHSYMESVHGTHRHAGLVPGVALEDQRWEDMVLMRDVLPAPAKSSAKKKKERETWIGSEKLQEDSKPWASKWRGPQHAIFGEP